ncbi:MAG: DUF1761 domain-containing protein [Cyclobacteriaceae bacterium]
MFTQHKSHNYGTPNKLRSHPVGANFILGFIWYTPLFGRAWAKELGFDTTIKPAGGQMAKGIIFMVIGNFLMAYVFAHNMAAWTFVPGMDNIPAIATILQSAIFTWLGFYLPVDLGAVAWEKKSWKLFGINTGYHLMMLFVAATILTLW